MKLLEQVRNEIRVRHYSIRTEEAYTHWIAALIYTHVIRRGPFGVVSPFDRLKRHPAVPEEPARPVVAPDALPTQPPSPSAGTSAGTLFAWFRRLAAAVLFVFLPGHGRSLS